MSPVLTPALMLWNGSWFGLESHVRRSINSGWAHCVLALLARCQSMHVPVGRGASLAIALLFVIFLTRLDLDTYFTNSTVLLNHKKAF